LPEEKRGRGATVSSDPLFPLSVLFAVGKKGEGKGEGEKNPPPEEDQSLRGGGRRGGS